MLIDFPVTEVFSNELRFIRTLEEFEGPILSEYHSINGSSYYLEKLCFVLNGTSRFLVVRTEARAIAEYLSLDMDLKQLLKSFSDGGGYIIDKNREGEIISSFAVRFSSLPENYFPVEGVLHDVDLRPRWEKTSQSFLIERWDGKLIAKLERYYLTLSSMVYFTSLEDQRKLPNTVLSYEYDGGFPVMHMYNSALTATPIESRAKCVGVSAASPGVLTIESPTEVVSALKKSIDGLEGAKEPYSILHAWSKTKPTDHDGIGNPVEVLEDITVLCEHLSLKVDALFPNPSELIQLPKRHKPYLLTAGKIVASYYRSLLKLVKEDEDYKFIG